MTQPPSWVRALHPTISDGNEEAPPKPVLEFPGATITQSADRISVGVASSTTAFASTTLPEIVGLHTTDDGKVTPAISSLRTVPFVGINKAPATSGSSVAVQTAGPFSRDVLNLGAGVACAVGVDASGVPVRATDPTCVSAPNWLGYCDEDGTITVLPRRASTLNLLDFGATIDGSDDSAAWAIATTFAGSGVLVLPVGTSRIDSSIVFDSPFVHIRGEHRDLSILQAGTASMTMLSVTSGIVGAKVLLEDLTIDMNGLAFSGLTANGAFFDSIEIRNCRFINMTTVSNGIQVFDGSNLTVDRCLFDGNGQIVAGAVSVTGVFQNVSFTRNVMRGLYFGILFTPNTTELAFANAVISENVVDFMYYNSPALPAWTGVTTAGTDQETLVDSSATFVVQPYQTPRELSQFGYIRAMPVRASGTVGSSLGNTLIDPSATFLSDGIIRGEIIRCGTAYGMVLSVESDTRINIEQWLDQTTTQPTTVPTNGTPYTVYGVYLGKIGASPASDEITIFGSWTDLDGTVVDPGIGTIWEAVGTPNYAFQCTDTVARVLFHGNAIKRSYGDAISTFGKECTVSNNDIVDCQDVGITLTGDDHIAHDNHIFREGSSCVYVGGSRSIVHDNKFEGWGLRTTSLQTSTVGSGAVSIAIYPETADSVLIHHNVCDGRGYDSATIGIGFDTVSNCRIEDNRILNLQPDHTDILINGSTTTGVKIRHDSASVVCTDTAGHGMAVGQLLDVYGEGSPQGILTAAPGSKYVDTLSARPWFKVTGTDAAGWHGEEVERGTFAGVYGLALFWDSRNGVIEDSNEISDWYDQASGLDAVNVGNPLYSASGGPNSIPKIYSFDGSTYLHALTDPIDDTSERTVFILGKQATKQGWALVFKRGGGAIAAFGYVDNAGTVYCYTDGVAVSNSVTGGGPAISGASILTYTFKIGQPVGLRVNAAAQTIAGGNVASGATGTTDGITIGYNESSASGSWDGEIDMILVFDRILSAAEIVHVEHELGRIAGISGV